MGATDQGFLTTEINKHINHRFEYFLQRFYFLWLLLSVSRLHLGKRKEQAGACHGSFALAVKKGLYCNRFLKGVPTSTFDTLQFIFHTARTRTKTLVRSQSSPT